MICRIDIKNMMDNDTRKKSIFEHILAVCGYVLFCALLLVAAGMVALIGAGIAVLFAGIVLFGVANVFGGLVLAGIGIAHMSQCIRRTCFGRHRNRTHDFPAESVLNQSRSRPAFLRTGYSGGTFLILVCIGCNSLDCR